jgi:hypothetical protein
LEREVGDRSLHQDYETPPCERGGRPYLGLKLDLRCPHLRVEQEIAKVAAMVPASSCCLKSSNNAGVGDRDGASHVDACQLPFGG